MDKFKFGNAIRWITSWITGRDPTFPPRRVNDEWAHLFPDGRDPRISEDWEKIDNSKFPPVEDMDGYIIIVKTESEELFFALQHCDVGKTPILPKLPDGAELYRLK